MICHQPARAFCGPLLRRFGILYKWWVPVSWQPSWYIEQPSMGIHIFCLIKECFYLESIAKKIRSGSCSWVVGTVYARSLDLFLPQFHCSSLPRIERLNFEFFLLGNWALLGLVTLTQSNEISTNWIGSSTAMCIVRFGDEPLEPFQIDLSAIACRSFSRCSQVISDFQRTNLLAQQPRVLSKFKKSGHAMPNNLLTDNTLHINGLRNKIYSLTNARQAFLPSIHIYWVDGYRVPLLVLSTIELIFICDISCLHHPKGSLSKKWTGLPMSKHGIDTHQD